ncbi:MAG: DUF1846 domain-containing protein [Clostridia bacterium]
MGTGFDHEKYLREQTEFILERVEKFNNKLYLEFGGKLFYDYHASRVLPGFDPNAKVKLLHKLKEKAEIIICVYGGAIESKKIRADFGITYDMDVMRLIDDLREWDLDINSVVITRYTGQPAAEMFRNKLERRGIMTYVHTHTPGYPTDVDLIVSENGYGTNTYIETKKPLVVVAAPGPGSGKLATCLSQLYHENLRGVSAGYSKFETFPIWNLPLKHPVNIAYEAATTDLNDKNMIDHFHLVNRGESTVNYNRDIEIFPVVKRIIEKITGEQSIYQSPTDMGVNRAGFCITDDEVCREASKQEVIRRYFISKCEYEKGFADEEVPKRNRLIMEELGLSMENRKVVLPAREAAFKGNGANGSKSTGAAIMLMEGEIITGKNSSLMNAYAGVILNAIKYLAGLPEDMHIMEPGILEPIIKLKRDSFSSRKPVLDAEEVLIALSISAVEGSNAELALAKLGELKGCEAHSTHMINPPDEAVFRNLGINLTCDAEFESKDLYYI